MQAWLRVREREAHKREAMKEGLLKLGFKMGGGDLPLGKGSLLMTWNLHGVEEYAKNLAQAGGTVIVVENPYVKYDKEGNEYLAMARNGHNGSGFHPTGGTERLEKLGYNPKPWAQGGYHILVCDQRGIGSSTMRSPLNWGTKEVVELRKKTSRAITLRPHPGRVLPGSNPPLKEQLRGAHAVVVWASNVATEALLEGVPVFYEAPHITLAKASKKGIAEIENPWKGDRTEAFVNLSWSQWNLKEISSGDAIKRLIECTSTPPNTSSQAPSAQPSDKG